jgi:LmbE family N-acetylglucosaminyl deacetylase
MISATVLGSASPALAGRYKTPSPEQATFYEQLRKGERPSTRKVLPVFKRKAIDAAPATARSLAAPVLVSTAVYVSAHPDDFVLFMNPYRDVSRNDTRAIFIFVTAGDAGAGKGPREAPYYLARENGAFRAIRFMADAASSTVTSPKSDWPYINGHRIFRTVYKNTTTFYLRLPDGAVEGTGYPIHDWASLAKLKTGETSTIRAVDGSTTYRGWNDLVKTLTTIVSSQATGTPNVWLDTHDYDPTINPGDHSDHIATGQAVAAIQPSLTCVNLAYHVGYSTSGLINLDLDDIANRSAGFGNYASGLAEKGYPGMAWEPGHKSWLAGMVYRLVSGNGQSCNF